MAGVRWLPAVLAACGLAVAGCSDDGDPGSSGEAGATESVTTVVTESVTVSPEPTTDPRLATEGLALHVRTSVRRLGVGDVVDGAILGDEAFCPGGDFRDEHGTSVEEGLVIKTFRCAEDRLTIGFSPQQQSFVQSAPWHVIDGEGRFAGAVGEGWVTAQFADDQSGQGVEELTGAVLLAD